MFVENIVPLGSSQLHLCINDVVLAAQGPAWVRVQPVYERTEV